MITETTVLAHSEFRTVLPPRSRAGSWGIGLMVDRWGPFGDREIIFLLCTVLVVLAVLGAFLLWGRL